MAALSASRSESEPASALRRILLTAFGSTERVERLIGDALAAARLATLPKGAPALMALVKAHVVPLVGAELGMRIAVALVEDLAAELGVEPASAESSREMTSHPRPVSRASNSALPASGGRPARVVTRARTEVLLLDTNRLNRATFARAIVRSGSDVRVCESLEDIASELASDGVLSAAILDMDHAQIEAIVLAILEVAPLLPVVARATNPNAATAFLRAAGAESFEVRPQAASEEELLELVRRVLAS